MARGDRAPLRARVRAGTLARRRARKVPADSRRREDLSPLPLAGRAPGLDRRLEESLALPASPRHGSEAGDRVALGRTDDSRSWVSPSMRIQARLHLTMPR